MFVSDRFVYMELHKTGGTHIRSILTELLDGELIGKHNQATPELFSKDRVFMGSVRNPWVWYTSLWGYGCDHRGAVFSNVTRHSRDIRGFGWTKNPYAAFLRFLATRSSDPQAWKDTYADINDAAAFRAWLRMMHDWDQMAVVGEGYGLTPLSRVVGLMTIRYLRLFCAKRGQSKTLHQLSTFERVQAYEQQNCFINHFIKNESLEVDLLSGLGSHGVDISETLHSSLLSRPKTNASSRKHGPRYYYDSESSDIIAERERLIIEKFGYAPPALDAGEG